MPGCVRMSPALPKAASLAPQSTCTWRANVHRWTVFARPHRACVDRRSGVVSVQSRASGVDRATIQTSTSASRSVQDKGPGPGALDNFMKLPVEQYAVLEASEIIRLGPNLFELKGPNMAFFDIKVEPSLLVTVDVDRGAPGRPPSVSLKSDRADVTGSPFVESLNEKFNIGWTTKLEWTSAPGGTGAMNAQASLQLDTDVIPPFNLMPRNLFNASVQGVLDTMMPPLLRVFLDRLAQDYERWAVDEDYREARVQQGQRLLSQDR